MFPVSPIIAFCASCETHLCDKCVYRHHQKWKWHHNIVGEFGHAYFESEHSGFWLERNKLGLLETSIEDNDTENKDEHLEEEILTI